MVADTPHKNTQRLPRLLGVTELSDYLSVPVSTLYAWRSRGVGPIGTKVGKLVRYREQDVIDWLNARSSKGGGSP